MSCFVVRNRIEPKIQKILRKKPDDFRRNRSTTSQNLTIRRILEGVCVKSLKQQYYLSTFPRLLTPCTEGRWRQILLAHGLPKEIVPAIMMLYKKHKSKSPLSGWKQRLLWYSSRRVEKRHICPIPVYHLLRLRALNIYTLKEKKMVSSWQRKEAEDILHKQIRTRTMTMT